MLKSFARLLFGGSRTMIEDPRPRGFVESLSGHPIKFRLIPLLESFYQAKDRLKLTALALQGKSTVLSKLNGKANHDTGKFAVFNIYQPGGISRFVRRVLDQMNARGYNIYICTNAKLRPDDQEFLLANCHRLVLRRNIGRDFGGYKDCFLDMFERFTAPDAVKRVIVLNDSLYFFEENLGHVFDELDNPKYDHVGVLENFEFHYHVGSFMFALSGRAIGNPKFRKFWKAYEPLSTRRHSINQGEVGLTKVLKKAGFRPHVIYSTMDVYRYIEDSTIQSLLELPDLMPKPYRKQYGNAGVWQAVERGLSMADPDNRTEVSVAAEKGNSPPVVTQNKSTIFGGGVSTDVLQFSEDAKLRLMTEIMSLDKSESTSYLRTRVRKEIADEISSFVFRGSQIHLGAGMWTLMRVPIMKRDIVFRDLYDFYEVPKLLAHLPKDEQEDIIHDIRTRGHPYSMPPFERLLWYWGFI